MLDCLHDWQVQNWKGSSTAVPMTASTHCLCVIEVRTTGSMAGHRKGTGVEGGGGGIHKTYHSYRIHKGWLEDGPPPGLLMWKMVDAGLVDGGGESACRNRDRAGKRQRWYSERKPTTSVSTMGSQGFGFAMRMGFDPLRMGE